MAKPWLRWSKVRYEQRCLAAAIKPSSCVVAWLQLRGQRRMATGFQRRPFWPNLKQRLLLRESGKRALASEVSDGAYDTKACHAAIAQRNAQAVIPPRKNAQTWKATLVGAHARNEALRACDRLGRSIWKKWSGYHRRSLVETKMHCFKRLGQRVMARTFERQVVELHVRVALLNRFTQLGRPSTVPVGAMA